MKKSLLVLVMFMLMILGGCSSKSIQGEWEEIDKYGKGDKLVITETEISVNNEVLNYKISEDKKHIVISQGQNSDSASYELDGDKLTVDGDVYYRIGSKEHEEQEKKIEK